MATCGTQQGFSSSRVEVGILTTVAVDGLFSQLLFRFLSRTLLLFGSLIVILQILSILVASNFLGSF